MLEKLLKLATKGSELEIYPYASGGSNIYEAALKIPACGSLPGYGAKTITARGATGEAAAYALARKLGLEK